MLNIKKLLKWVLFMLIFKDIRKRFLISKYAESVVHKQYMAYINEGAQGGSNNSLKQEIHFTNYR